MDQELLALLAQHKDELRREIADVRREVADVRQEVTGLRQEVTGLRQEVTGLRQEVTGLRGEVDAFRVEMRNEMVAFRVEIREEMVRHRDELRGYFGVSLEQALAELRATANGYASLSRQFEEHRRESEVAHREILATIRLVHADLDRRVSRLERGGGEG